MTGGNSTGMCQSDAHIAKSQHGKGVHWQECAGPSIGTSECRVREAEVQGPVGQVRGRSWVVTVTCGGQAALENSTCLLQNTREKEMNLSLLLLCLCGPRTQVLGLHRAAVPGKVLQDWMRQPEQERNYCRHLIVV